MCHVSNLNVANRFDNSARKHGSKPALFIGKKFYSYSQIKERVVKMAALITQTDHDPDINVGAVFAYRTTAAYSGILATLYSGKGYAPLNPNFPITRNLHILNLSGARIIIIDKYCEETSVAILKEAEQNLSVLMPEHETLPEWTLKQERHKFYCRRDLACEKPSRSKPADAAPDSTAYLLFTSGSTGIPKGVKVSHGNADRYIDSMIKRYGPTPRDRFSQNSDITFDASFYDMFVCWGAGACLYSVPQSARMAPAKFIQEHELTFWESVPSIIGFMKRMFLLKPGAFPSIRWSLFGGEQLTMENARQWQGAAPNSRIENAYGPTEGTVCVLGYVWQPGVSEAECHNGSVPIGLPYPEQDAAIFKDGIRLTHDGARGELHISGDQVVQGYWQTEEETRKRFIEIPDQEGTKKRWYRTGDLVLWREGVGFIFLGRIDRQLKIRGYRVEIGEIEHTIMKAAGTDQVAVLGWPETDKTVSSVVAFVSGSKVSNEEILNYCATRLPGYMVPRALHNIDRFPLNSNGKIDFFRLKEILADSSSQRCR